MCLTSRLIHRSCREIIEYALPEVFNGINKSLRKGESCLLPSWNTASSAGWRPLSSGAVESVGFPPQAAASAFKKTKVQYNSSCFQQQETMRTLKTSS